MLPNLTLFNVEMFSSFGVITPRRPSSSKFSSVMRPSSQTMPPTSLQSRCPLPPMSQSQ